MAGQVVYLDDQLEIVIRYKNYKGEVADRRIIPGYLTFGEVEWHKGAQWLLYAKDLDKGADRTFAVKDILKWGVPKPEPKLVLTNVPSGWSHTVSTPLDKPPPDYPQDNPILSRAYTIDRVDPGGPNFPPNHSEYVQTVRNYLVMLYGGPPHDDTATGAEEWVHLAAEPCKFCRRPGQVYFLRDDGPEGRDGLQPMRCDNCGRNWHAGHSAA